MSTVTPFPAVSEFINVLQTRKCKFYSPVYHQPVISIISSFFNAHTYFEATYESIINQTFQNFEWIIVDDCSTEPEACILFQSLPKRYVKIKTLQHHTNKGLAVGRNTAITYATGKYLFFMDLDDLIDPTYIEKCVLFLETHPEFSFVNSYSVGFQAQEYWWTHGFNKPSQFIHQNWVTGRLLYRKSDFDCLGGFDENLRFYEDWERWLKAIANNQKGWTIPEYLDCYRRLDSGLLTISKANVTEERRVTELIQSRYQDFFNHNYLPDISIERYNFTSDSGFPKIDIINPLEKDYSRKYILCFFPHLEVGGADKFNIDLVTLLATRGYELTIVTTSKSEHPWQKHFYAVTSDIFHLPNFLQDSDWLDFTKYIIQSRQIDIVFISNSYIAYYFLPLLRNEFPDIAFIDFTHTIDHGWRGCGYPRLSCKFSQFLDLQIVSSHHLGEYYRCLNPQTTEKLQVSYTNVDTNKW
ncbi:MAG: glycosyltransferase, partial [Nostoc sp.]